MRDYGRRSQSQGRSVERVTIVVLMIVGFGLLIVGRTEPEVFDGLKQRALITISPILEASSGPINSARNWRRALDDMMSVYEDNRRLRAENEELRVQAGQARRLQSLVERYQALLNVKVDPNIDYLTARVIGDSGGPFSRSLLINAGRADGVRTGEGVVDANGLVGHIVSTGPGAARALLLIDVESHIPVLVEGNNLRAMLTGDGKDRAFLEHLPPGAPVKKGSRVVTSGVAGLLPPGILVGIVGEAIEGSSEVSVTLASSFDRLDVVRVLRYEMPLQAEPMGGLSNDTTSPRQQPGSNGAPANNTADASPPASAMPAYAVATPKPAAVSAPPATPPTATVIRAARPQSAARAEDAPASRPPRSN